MLTLNVETVLPLGAIRRQMPSAVILNIQWTFGLRS